MEREVSHVEAVGDDDFLGTTLGVIDTYIERFGTKPQVLRMRAPFYDGLQAQFERITQGKGHGLVKVCGVKIEKVSLIYKHDIEVL